jgi:RIO kinase 1
MLSYVEGDPRFNAEKARHKKREFVQLWARKEFANLRACFEAGVSVPEPIAFRENVVLMEFVGVKGVPCALLEDVVLQEPKKVFEHLLDAVKNMYSAGIVHADLSSFNVLIKPETEKPVLIDFGQGVSVEHPRAQEFLDKDVNNVLKYFERQAGIKKDFVETMDFVKGKQ